MTARSSTTAGEERLATFSELSPARARETSRRRAIGPYALWAVQIALALLFLFAGGIKFVLSAEDLTKDTVLSATFLRFVGVCEVLGGMGLILPGALRFGRFLTPLAAAGLVIIMIGATVITTVELNAAEALFPLAIGLLLALVIYARRSWFPARPQDKLTRPKE